MTTREILEKEIGKDKVLVVNSAMQVKEIVPWGDAASMLWNEKAYTLLARSDGKKLCSPSVEWDWPVVVVLVKYSQHHHRIFNLEDSVTKAYVRQRDSFTCAYCGEYGNTVDHIQPKSRGGENTWANLVTACKGCNGRKADRTPEEAGMKRPVIKSGITVNSKLKTVQDLMYKALDELV